MEKKEYDLKFLAKQAMRQRGLEPEFSKEVLDQLDTLNSPGNPPKKSQDLRRLLFCSIDNEDSSDLDQLTFAQKDHEGNITLWIAVADVDALVPKDSAIDLHAKINTTSVYTPAKIFPMLPEKLSHNLTSLNEGEDRAAIIVEVKINGQGEILRDRSEINFTVCEEKSGCDLEDFSAGGIHINTSKEKSSRDESNFPSETVKGISERSLRGRIFQALVHNFAKLTYNAVAEWLEGKADVPEKVRRVDGLKEALLVQHEASQILQKRRHDLGALTLEPPDIQAKIVNDQKVILELPFQNFAQSLIENFMIAANHVMADHFRKLQIPSLRRVVRIPKRWDRIVEIAASLTDKLPKEPDSKALEQFLIRRKRADPSAFPDLSLTVIKLMGRGEYVVEYPGQIPIGHFGLALSEYTHSTAPNRRYPDLISERQMKAFLTHQPSPYTLEELQSLALHCTAQEDAAAKVERQMKKVAEALFLSESIGTVYQGIITGAGEKGTWVRVISPPVEGKVVKGYEKLDVGDSVSVELISVDVPKGFINFARTR